MPSNVLHPIFGGNGAVFLIFYIDSKGIWFARFSIECREKDSLWLHLSIQRMLHLDSPFKGIKQLEPQLLKPFTSPLLIPFGNWWRKPSRQKWIFSDRRGYLRWGESERKGASFSEGWAGAAGSFRYPGLFVAWEPRFSRKGSTQTAASGQCHGLRKRGHDQNADH